MIRHEASNRFDCLALRASFAAGRPCLVALGLASLLCASGCNAFGLGNGRVVQELRTENERLLTEFRSERDRRQSMENQLRVMENRLAESEKLLASQYSPTDRRLSQLAPLPSTSPNLSPGKLSSSGQASDGRGGDEQSASGSELRWQRRMTP